MKVWLAVILTPVAGCRCKVEVPIQSSYWIFPILPLMSVVLPLMGAVCKLAAFLSFDPMGRRSCVGCARH